LRPRSGQLALGALLASLAPLACGGESGASSPGEWRATVDTVGDTITVRTLSGSVWGDTATLVAEVTIGTLDGADEYLIGDPVAIAVGGDGVVYMLDRQVPVVRAYAPDGTWLRDLGREGGGPGEFRQPNGLAVLPDGRILVRDRGNVRIDVFGPGGEHLTEWPVMSRFGTRRRFYTDTAGNSYVTSLAEVGLPPWQWTYILLRYSSDGDALDTIPAPTWDHEFARITATDERSTNASPVPFTAVAAWTFSSLGYMVGGLSTDYRIDLYRVDAPVLRIEREWTPVPVKADEAEERRRAITTRLRRQYSGWRWNGPPVPESKPPFRDMFTSWEGNIWVLLSQEGRPTMSEAEAREEEQLTGEMPIRFEEPAAFDVFAPDGRFLGHVKVPESFQIRPEPIVRGDTVWAVTRDELDVASVVRFRIAHLAQPT
jgi:hypothetical protein